MGSVPVDKAGVGSAVINAMRQVGGSLGIAVMGTLVATSVSVGQRSPAYATQFVEATTVHCSPALRSSSPARSSRS
jgi:hypothetical protein